MTRLGYRFYYLFIICNFTNAVFFYCFLPETAKVSLENMDKIFDGSWFVPGARPLTGSGGEVIEGSVKNDSAITHQEVAERSHV